MSRGGGRCVLENEKRVLAAILWDEEREEGAEELPLSNTF